MIARPPRADRMRTERKLRDALREDGSNVRRIAQAVVAQRLQPITTANGNISPYKIADLIGDVIGSILATTVVALQGRPFASTSPLNGQAIAWNATAGQWEPTTIASGGSAGEILTNGDPDFPEVMFDETGDVVYDS